MPFPDVWGDYLLALVLLAVLALAWTIYVLRRRRNFQPGPRKGVARNPRAVRRQNPPDPPD